jgi:Fe2+ or Zn2+ uptake regulation protein
LKKFSKQRELILSELQSRTDHPTVDKLYMDLKKQMSNIGIATIYRNISYLHQQGEILKMSMPNEPDRYDGNNKPHIHFICQECSEIYDIMLDDIKQKELNDNMKMYSEMIEATFKSYQITIKGKCKKCT